LYARGQGLPKDYRVAIQWYRRAAEQGDALAQFQLGVLYANGQGVRQNYEIAGQWYRRAADQGDAVAQFNLGVRYANGQGVPQNDELAGRWYRRAAQQGHARAQSNLGVLYANGQGVPKDVMRAYMWLTIAVAGSRGDDDGKPAIANQTIVASDLTAAQIEQAQEMARHCQDTQFLQCEPQQNVPGVGP
jgi:TPR repeat protein